MAFFDEVHDSQRYRLGTRRKDRAGREFIYLKGAASTAAGDFVTFDTTGATARLVASAQGPVAVAMAAVNATTKFGWYCVHTGASKVSGLIAASSAASSKVGYEGSTGAVGDGRLAADQIVGVRAPANAGGAAAVVDGVQLAYPFVGVF